MPVRLSNVKLQPSGCEGIRQPQDRAFLGHLCPPPAATSLPDPWELSYGESCHSTGWSSTVSLTSRWGITVNEPST